MLDREARAPDARAVEPALGRHEVRAERQLYGASADALARLRRLPDKVDVVLVMGHNPGLQDLALALAAAGPTREQVAEEDPTAALATLEFDGGWPDLDPGGAQLVAFVRPRGLRRVKTTFPNSVALRHRG